MDQGFADLLEGAFSEINIDFQQLQSDEGTNTSQTQLVIDEDEDDMNGASKWLTSEQSLVETHVYEQDTNEESSDSSDSESSNSFAIHPVSTICLSHEIDSDPVLNTMITEQQLHYKAGEFTAEEENMQSDLAAGVSVPSMKEDVKLLTEEEDTETFNVEYQQQTLPQTPEETSSQSEEDLQENNITKEQSSQCESVGNEDEPFLAMSPNIAHKYDVRDEIKDFTEEDQEQIEESLADYPSDLSHSETEESAENVTLHDHCTESVTELSNAERVNKDYPAQHTNSGIKGLVAEMISADTDQSSQRGKFNEEDVQESLTKDKNTETIQDTMNVEDTEYISNVNNQADCISDSSSDDDHGPNQEETNFISLVEQEEEINYVTQHNYSSGDMEMMDNNIEHICSDMGDKECNSPENQNMRLLLFCDVEEKGFTSTNPISYDEESMTGPTELHCSTASVKSNTDIKNSDKSSSEAFDNVDNAKNLMSEGLWSALLMNEDNLRLDEYDWGLTGDSVEINSGEGENEEYTEDAMNEFSTDDDDDDDEGTERDWEQEKTRIEAFYRFYGEQTEPEEQVGRNHKVTFCLDNESSEYDEEDSDSTEEELDSDLNTPDLNTLKPEYQSESDDPLEKPYYPERSRKQPKEQQPVCAAVKQHPPKNRCFAMLKSTLAFVLLTAIGIVSYWWATEDLEWSHGHDTSML
ncbi:dentin sialophosphoprotein isoform X2 [Silurus meridionalis]|uniref:dentin sialophosphoprotein isoform X2 n=1 Tax=Silurus meridionalis TaxID=175797 RepID=UPI001EEA1E60|nr:dentin sialophosphoprotein isoform X2 [Silurus meridionalis]